MKKLLFMSLLFGGLSVSVQAQDSMNKKMENKTDKMVKKMENKTDKMNKKIDNKANKTEKKMDTVANRRKMVPRNPQ